MPGLALMDNEKDRREYYASLSDNQKKELIKTLPQRMQNMIKMSLEKSGIDVTRFFD